MGLYDEVHVGNRCGQTKALGRGIGRLVPGDAAQVIPAPVTAEEYTASMTGARQVAPVGDAAVAMCEGGYVVVRGGTLRGWLEEPPADLAVYDNLGHLLCRPGQAPALPEGYFYDSPARRTLIGHLLEGVEDEARMRLFGRVTLSKLDPVQDAAEIARRRADMAAAAEQELNSITGQPGSCGVCAALRASRTSTAPAST